MVMLTYFSEIEEIDDRWISNTDLYAQEEEDRLQTLVTTNKTNLVAEDVRVS